MATKTQKTKRTKEIAAYRADTLKSHKRRYVDNPLNTIFVIVGGFVPIDNDVTRPDNDDNFFFEERRRYFASLPEALEAVADYNDDADRSWDASESGIADYQIHIASWDTLGYRELAEAYQGTPLANVFNEIVKEENEARLIKEFGPVICLKLEESSQTTDKDWWMEFLESKEEYLSIDFELGDHSAEVVIIAVKLDTIKTKMESMGVIVSIKTPAEPFEINHNDKDLHHFEPLGDGRWQRKETKTVEACPDLNPSIATRTFHGPTDNL